MDRSPTRRQRYRPYPTGVRAHPASVCPFDDYDIATRAEADADVSIVAPSHSNDSGIR